MSWILGILGKQAMINQKKLQRIHHNPIFTYNSANLYLVAGGIKETLFTQTDERNINSGWCIVGVGIKNYSDSFSLMSKKDWATVLSDFKPDLLRNINGHFAIIRWDNNKVECYTDQLGLRNIYLTNLDHKFTVFSTRIDWVSKFHNKSVIDLKQFASQWLLINNLSLHSTLTKIDRLSQGGMAECTSNGYSYHNHPWIPSINSSLAHIDIVQILKKLTGFPLQLNNKLSLSFSGGIDSRVLISLLLSGRRQNWTVHSFGNSKSPDNIISKKLSSAINVENIFYETILRKEFISLENFNDFVSSTHAITPISASVGLSFYNSLHKANKIVIDGGFGEIARRRYLNRLLFFGKKTLLQKDIKGISSYLQIPRAPIFKQEILDIMYDGIFNQIEQLVDTLPEITDIGIENWLDLLAIRTRLPNILGYEQSRIDAKVINYMPFAQPEFLASLFNISVKERRNGKFLKKIIKNHPILTKFPLTKDGTYYTLNTPNLILSVSIKIKRKYGFAFKEDFVTRFLNEISELTQDTLNSQETKTCYLYNYDYLSHIISACYSGDTKFCSEVDWWLTFELWRRNVETYVNIFE